MFGLPDNSDDVHGCANLQLALESTHSERGGHGDLLLTCHPGSCSRLLCPSCLRWLADILRDLQHGGVCPFIWCGWDHDLGLRAGALLPRGHWQPERVEDHDGGRDTTTHRDCLGALQHDCGSCWQTHGTLGPKDGKTWGLRLAGVESGRCGVAQRGGGDGARLRAKLQSLHEPHHIRSLGAGAQSRGRAGSVRANGAQGNGARGNGARGH
mmetsp:Transcript_61865/g.125611  ORF Transcript_61865/g.125611 Transcript_61865/m.125611 type:complete len:211 (+) Transcript_61865:2099-2731(+)